MAGWSKAKRKAFEKAFYEYLDNCWINSKDAGHICLGKHLYEGQRKLISEILDGLEADIHKFYILKSRQLGITTITRALNIFYIGVHKGMKGALVFDTAPNREEARAELVTMIRDLPARLQFPKIKGSGEGNREGVTLMNDSKILFKNAGVKKSKSSGTLGRSVGLTVAHLSELCSYDNDEGLESFEQSLSDSHPDRLYIYESTARGFNRWWEIWTEARKDPAHCKCIFLGWWCKDSQTIPRSHADFLLYGATPPTDKEKIKIKQVREQYNVEITDEMLAWVRRKYDPTATREGDADPEFEGNTTRIQEQPWTEEDAFQQTGTIFFPAEKLTEATHNYASNDFKAFMFLPGAEFVDMQIMKAPNTRNTDLKVWEEPQPDAEYVIGIDPAFGENENNDRSSLQVMRCYADGIDQVAEYASPLIATHQFAWVIASLLGWYSSESNSYVRYALELNGPGMAVFNELKSLRHILENGYLRQQVEEKGLKDIFRNVRTYIYSRADSIGVGTNYHIKTSGPLKVTFMERLRDFVSNGMFRIRSLELIDEMKTIAREGDSISAPGSMKDDRVLSAAFAVHCWETGPRKQLITMRRTRELEQARVRTTIADQVRVFNQNKLAVMFAQKKQVRVNAQREQIRMSWRHR